jgi:hypothetical protein
MAPRKFKMAPRKFKMAFLYIEPLLREARRNSEIKGPFCKKKTGTGGSD